MVDFHTETLTTLAVVKLVDIRLTLTVFSHTLSPPPQKSMFLMKGEMHTNLGA